MSAYAPEIPIGSIPEGTPIGDHYRVLRLLGAGGMGEVYLAENVNLPDLRVAIKVLRRDLTATQDLADRLTDEARMQSRMNCDNVVQIYDFFRWREHYCLIQSYIEGTTLAGMIEVHPDGLPQAQALDLALDILNGLNHAHEQGVLHCDVKPANVLVDGNRRARVTDFGIAREVGAGGRDGAVVGTPAYMSPEQIETPEKVDHRTDVFSAGMVLFEMLTGRLAFDAPTAADATRYPQLTREPADIRDFRRDLSTGLSRIVTTALQRDPAARFQGCAEFRQAILRHRLLQRVFHVWLPAMGTVAVLALASAWGWKVYVDAETAAERARVEEQARRERAAVEELARREREAAVARARKAIDASLGTAVQQLDSLCREGVRLRARQQLMNTASGAGFGDLVAKFRQQVADIRGNMSDFARGYREAVGQLGKFDPALVAEMIDARPQADPDVARLLREVRADHAALTRPDRRDEQALLSTCPAG